LNLSEHFLPRLQLLLEEIIALDYHRQSPLKYKYANTVYILIPLCSVKGAGVSPNRATLGPHPFSFVNPTTCECGFKTTLVHEETVFYNYKIPLLGANGCKYHQHRLYFEKNHTDTTTVHKTDRTRILPEVVHGHKDPAGKCSMLNIITTTVPG